MWLDGPAVCYIRDGWFLLAHVVIDRVKQTNKQKAQMKTLLSAGGRQDGRAAHLGLDKRVLQQFAWWTSEMNVFQTEPPKGSSSGAASLPSPSSVSLVSSKLLPKINSQLQMWTRSSGSSKHSAKVQESVQGEGENDFWSQVSVGVQFFFFFFHMIYSFGKTAAVYYLQLLAGVRSFVKSRLRRRLRVWASDGLLLSGNICSSSEFTRRELQRGEGSAEEETGGDWGPPNFQRSPLEVIIRIRIRMPSFILHRGNVFANWFKVVKAAYTASTYMQRGKCKSAKGELKEIKYMCKWSRVFVFHLWPDRNISLDCH